MTVIIDDKGKKKIPFEEYDNSQITVRDLLICSSREIPLPRIVNSIYKKNPDSDRWFCYNCKAVGDKWYLMTHLCLGPNRYV